MGLFVRGPDAGPWPQSRAVDTLLGILEFIIQECLNGVGGRRDELGHRVFPRAGRALENVVGTLLLGRRLADPDSQSREVVGAERLGDRTQSVVSQSMCGGIWSGRVRTSMENICWSTSQSACRASTASRMMWIGTLTTTGSFGSTTWKST